MKTSYISIAIASLLMGGQANAQQGTKTVRKPVATSLAVADKTFIQEAINSNNEAMTLAQMALQQTGSADVKKIARQFSNDHLAAQKKLYAIAGMRDSIPYKLYYNTNTTTSKLPLTDNLDSRRNRTMGTIVSSDTTPRVGATNNSVASNTTGTGTQSANPYTGTSYAVINQTYNGNTSIDNAVGVNNSNRTDIGGYSGRWTENTTVVNNQPLTVAAPPAVNPVTSSSNLPTGSVANNTGIPATGTANNLDNMPNFPNRTVDTVRQTGSSMGFQDPGMNLSSPGNERYARTTPNTRPNTNAGSDYGYSGIAVNNTPTNALNTAAYSNNELNGNIVQTGQQQGTYNPTSVINSSTTSLNNTQVAFNNANANRANERATQARPNGTVATNPANGTNTNTTPIAVPVATPNGDTVNNVVPILVGKAGNRSTAMNTGNTNSKMTSSTAGFYTSPVANTSATSAVSTATPETFDNVWVEQMLATQQQAIVKYEAALKRTHHTQLKLYINTVLPILHGHQYALQQWQAKQK